MNEAQLSEWQVHGACYRHHNQQAFPKHPTDNDSLTAAPPNQHKFTIPIIFKPPSAFAKYRQLYLSSETLYENSDNTNDTSPTLEHSEQTNTYFGSTDTGLDIQGNDCSTYDVCRLSKNFPTLQPPKPNVGLKSL